MSSATMERPETTKLEFSLADFPAHRLRKNSLVYRAQPVDAPIGWTPSRSGFGVFDLPEPRGTYYAATEQDSAVQELLGPIAGRFNSISERQAARIHVVPMRVTRPFKLAAMDHPKARRFGLNGQAFESFLQGGRTREWADALAAEGFDGLLLGARFSPTMRKTLCALFGPEQPTKTPPLVMAGRPIPGAVAAAAAGFTVTPYQTRAHLDII